MEYQYEFVNFIVSLWFVNFQKKMFLEFLTGGGDIIL